MRLARFNIQTHDVDKKYFIGLPIPAGAATVSTLVLATPEPLVDRVWMAGLLALTIVLSYLMISTIRYRSFKDLDLKRRRPAWILPVIAVAFAVVAFRPTLSLLALALAFAASGRRPRLVRLLPPQAQRNPKPEDAEPKPSALSPNIATRRDRSWPVVPGPGRAPSRLSLLQLPFPGFPESVHTVAASAPEAARRWKREAAATRGAARRSRIERRLDLLGRAIRVS